MTVAGVTGVAGGVVGLISSFMTRSSTTEAQLFIINYYNKKNNYYFLYWQSPTMRWHKITIKKMRKLFILAIVIMLNAVINIQAQTTMELLTNTNWEPQNYFDEDEGERGYIKFTTTTRTYVEDIDGEIDRAPNEFYLSNSIEYTFDNSKVGKNTTGRYIIRNGAGYVFIAEIIELTSEKLITQNLTPNFTSTGHITTHLPTTLNF